MQHRPTHLAHRTAGVLLARASLVAGSAPLAGDAAAAAHVTVQGDLRPAYGFSPASIAVAPGTTVTWTSSTITTRHTVTQCTAANDCGSEGGPPLQGFDSHDIAPGASFALTFPGRSTATTYLYYCFNHPEMRGSVTVQAVAAAPSPATTAAPPATTSPPASPHSTAPTPSPSASSSPSPAGSGFAAPTPSGTASSTSSTSTAAIRTAPAPAPGGGSRVPLVVAVLAAIAALGAAAWLFLRRA